MLHVDRIADLRGACERARSAGQRVGVVPTMGYLHDGHRSLMRAARARSDFVVVTIFVNPLQFGPTEDLDRYPRDLAGDLAACEAEGVECVFTPSVAEMYPRPPLTTVHVDAYQLGERALQRLLRRDAGEPAPGRSHEVLPTWLVVRASCGSTPGEARRAGHSPG